MFTTIKTERVKSFNNRLQSKSRLKGQYTVVTSFVLLYCLEMGSQVYSRSGHLLD
jgi:hypothetical protein